jgi:hypothetical protein
MLPGYNHNISYKGQTFHIQTEDSGLNRPHIITLLFVKGNIISRKKKEYNEIVSRDNVDNLVRELMQEQHKLMLKDLKNGTFDQHLGGAAPVAAQAAPLAPAPPPAQVPSDEVIEEKPAQKTIAISDDKELSDEDIFGADLISDKSLDEVILSFLSEQIDDDQDGI